MYWLRKYSRCVIEVRISTSFSLFFEDSWTTSRKQLPKLYLSHAHPRHPTHLSLSSKHPRRSFSSRDISLSSSFSLPPPYPNPSHSPSLFTPSLTPPLIQFSDMPPTSDAGENSCNCPPLTQWNYQLGLPNWAIISSTRLLIPRWCSSFLITVTWLYIQPGRGPTWHAILA